MQASCHGLEQADWFQARGLAAEVGVYAELEEMLNAFCCFQKASRVKEGLSKAVAGPQRCFGALLKWVAAKKGW